MDFFFDGGSKMRAGRLLSQQYLDNISEKIASEEDVDFYLLQEVDKEARRTYYVNQYDYINNLLNNRVSSFAVNYKSYFVPQPLSNPMGKVIAGLMNIGKYTPKLAVRHRLENDASWPVGLFMLKRCLLEWRFDLPGGKELVLINVHLSAYDDGSVKQKQMKQLKEILSIEEAKGNYVIVGGDWNQEPPKPGEPNFYFPSKKWNWVYSKDFPTNRDLSAPLDANTKTFNIDYFLISDNIKILDFGVDVQNFQNSDHEPLYLKIKLRR
jgi:endonuclease/exonuclease/phosphatase family metal-dependent hydrolase